jgi:serine/threonine protein kinase
MGIVYEARDPVLDRPVALKVIQPSAEGDAARSYEERFLAEAQSAAKLQHPGIVVVHDVGRDPATNRMYIALELLQGRTLAELGAAGPLDWRTVFQLVAQVARALGHAHQKGVVHRDVKPANIVVQPSGEAKVMDFGIARLASAGYQLTTTGEFIGTPLYTAPEQARTEEVDGRADIFSLASVAYTLLTGRAAFMAPTIPGIVHRVVYEDPDPPSLYTPGLPRDAERVLSRALAKEPSARYATGEAFAEDAEDVLAGLPPRHAAGDDLVVVPGPDGSGTIAATPAAGPLGQAPETPNTTRSLESPPARPRRRPNFALALTLAAAGVGLALLVLWRSPRRPAPSPKAPVAAARQPTTTPTARPRPTPAPTPVPEPGHLRIDFDHPLKTGHIRVFVDDELALDEWLSGQEKTKALVFKLHGGTFRDVLDVSPGLHEIRVEVRWDDNVRKERIVGNFRSGATRRLDASLGRIRRDLSLDWR